MALYRKKAMLHIFFDFLCHDKIFSVYETKKDLLTKYLSSYNVLWNIFHFGTFVECVEECSIYLTVKEMILVMFETVPFRTDIFNQGRIAYVVFQFFSEPTYIYHNGASICWQIRTPDGVANSFKSADFSSIFC